MMPKSDPKKNSFNDIIKKYSRKDIIRLMVVYGYNMKDLRKVLKPTKRAEIYRLMEHYKIPKEFRASNDKYSIYSIAFMRYVAYLGLNSSEVAMFGGLKFKNAEEYTRYANMELRLVSDDLKTHKIVKLRSGERRPPKQFINRYFLPHAIEGGFSMKDFCRLTGYTRGVLKDFLERLNMMVFWEPLVKNDALSLPEKPAAIIREVNRG